MDQFRRKHNRVKGYDYGQNGAYFITVCSKDRKNLFRVVGAVSDRQSKMPMLSEIGGIVDYEISRLSQVYGNISVEKYIIMPNHVHMIIMIKDRRPEVAPTLSRAMKQFKGAVTKKAGFPVWQRSFYDHIIRDEQDYLEVWNYIDTNPIRWGEDKYFS